MKYQIARTTQFKKDFKLAKKQNLDLSLITEVITKLANEEPLPPEYHDHALSGNWSGHRECHIQPDWLLIYHIDNDVLVLSLVRTGSHSNLFGK